VSSYFLILEIYSFAQSGARSHGHFWYVYGGQQLDIWILTVFQAFYHFSSPYRNHATSRNSRVKHLVLTLMAGFIEAPLRALCNLHWVNQRPSTPDLHCSSRSLLIDLYRYVEFAMNRVRMLIHFGVVPYLVFDGANLPSKAGTDSERHSRRAESRALGLELLRLGRTSQAHQELQKAVDVTPEMAGLLIQELKRAGVKYIVAPYEADAQLAYLEKKGIIDGIISEDSDLLVFGARCLLTKLDQYGECVMIRRDDFTACREISLVGWSDQDFRRMAILSGCDYLDNIGKMGLKTAYRLLRKHKTIERVLQAVRLEGKMKVPPNYLESFLQAEMTFLYHWVFCPTANAIVNITEPEAWIKVCEMNFLGDSMEDTVGAGVARGELHPQTKKPLVLPHTRTNTDHSRLKQGSRIQEKENLQTKKGVSIAEFFKPKRIPLAELEPNAFILTPRQQELARNASTASWSSPIAQPARTEDAENAPNSAPAATRRTFGTALLQTPNSSRVKRQRLCQEDLPEHGSSQDSRVLSGTSKFFSRPEKRKRKQTIEFDIHSDDSIEEALRNLPDPTEMVQPSRLSAESLTAKSSVDQIIAGTPKLQGEEDESQLTLVAVTASPQQVADVDSEDTIVEEESSSQSGLFDKYLLADIQTMRRSSASIQTKRCIKPLIESKKICTQTAVISEEEVLPTLPNHDRSIDDDGLSASVWQETESIVVVPASDAVEPSSPLATRETRSFVANGSEDLLLSESEIDSADDRLPQKKLNLRQFAFTAA
jgi:exonuclease 1